MISRSIVYLLALSIFFLLGASCAPVATPTPAATVSVPSPTVVPTKAVAETPTTTPAKPLTPTVITRSRVKFGAVGSYDNIAAFLAMDKDFFAKEGVDLDYVPFELSNAMLPPLATGELDAGSVLVMPNLLNAADRGVGIKLVATKGESRPGYDSTWVLLRKDLADSGQVKTPADLKGRKVAIINRGSLSHQTAELLLARGSLVEKDLDGGEFVVLGPNDQASAFANKAIAASYIMDPQATAIVDRGLAVRWFGGSSLFPGNIAVSSVIAFSPQFVKNTQAGRNWMVAYLRGIRDYDEAMKTAQGREDITRVLAKYTSMKDPKLLAALDPAYIDPNGVMDSGSMKTQYDWLVKGAYYEGKTTFSDLLDTSFAAYATEKLGKE